MAWVPFFHAFLSESLIRPSSQRQPFLGQRRPGHVLAELLKTATIATVDRRTGVHAAHLGG